MQENKRIEIKRKINNLFDTGINKLAVFKLIDELLSENEPITHLIWQKQFKPTENAFESDLMIFKRSADNNYIFDTFLKEVK